MRFSGTAPFLVERASITTSTSTGLSPHSLHVCVSILFPIFSGLFPPDGYVCSRSDVLKVYSVLRLTDRYELRVPLF